MSHLLKTRVIWFALGALLSAACLLLFRQQHDELATDNRPIPIMSTPHTEHETTSEAVVARTLPKGLSVEQANQLKEKGVYVLDSEILEVQAMFARKIDMLNAMIDERVGREYHYLFSELGIDPLVQNQIIQHLRKLMESKVRAAQYLTVSTYAESAFNDLLQEKLSDSQATYYRDLEHSRPLEYEVGLIKRFVSERTGQPLGAQAEATLENLIRDYAAISERSKAQWGGAFDTIRIPAYGQDAERLIMLETANWQVAWKEILNDPALDGVDTTVRSALESYVEDFNTSVSTFVSQQKDLQDSVFRQAIEIELAELKLLPEKNARRIGYLNSLLNSSSPLEPGG